MPATTRNEPLGRDQAVADLEARLAAARERQAATAEILSAIASSPGDAEQSVRRIAEITERLFGASSVSVMIADGERWGLTIRVGAGSERINSAIPVAHVTIAPLFMPGAVYLENRQIHVPDIDDPAAIARWPGITPARAAGTRTLCGTPLRREGKAIGTLIVHRDRLAPFTADELELLQSFADQAAIAAENARLINETRDALERQTATAEVLRVISQSPTDVQPVFDAVVSTAVRLLRCDICFVLLRSGNTFSPMAGAGPQGPLPDLGPRNLPIDPDANFPSRAILGKTMLHLPDWSKIELPEHERQMRSIIGVNASLFLPLLHQDECIGLLALASKRANAFSENDIALAESFRDQALIAIQNTRLFNETREALERQTATADILKVIASSPSDVQPVFEAIAERSQRLVDALSTTVFRLVDGIMHLKAFTSVSPEADAALKALFPAPLADFSWGEAVASGAIHRVLDTEDEVPGLRDLARLRGFRSMLFVPLLRDGAPIGVIAVTRVAPGPFPDHYVELLCTFADQAVIAIQNVQLFDEVQARTRDLQESLQQQTATADVLKVISRSAFDLDTVMNTLTSSAARLCGADGCGLYLADGDKLVCRGMDDAGDADRSAFLRQTTIPIDETSGIGRAMIHGVVTNIGDFENDPGARLRKFQQKLGFKAILIVPLMREGRAIGAFALVRNQVGMFTQRQVDLVQTFADQAVIAIENARLFDEVQARTRDLQESLQQQTATADVLKVISRSAFDLQTVLETLIQSAVELSDAKRGSIFLRDGELFRFRAATRADLYPEWIRFLEQNPQKAGQHSAIARSIAGGRTVCVPDVLADPEIKMPAALADIRAVLAVPLLRNGRADGVMALSRETPGPFNPRQIDLVETFADQAVIAIENARLFGEVQARTRELSASLEELRTAQDRLVQTEKLASLGQLTAGIAHEIKNPLNFINNFSALSVELIDELLDVLKPAPLDAMIRGDVDELTHMLKGNLDKVAQHGRRADSIVKNMLLHSREGSGEHRPADINALVEESLNLAYHGARAERSGFNVTLRRDFAPDAGTADLYPQEITRVLLNLMTNGFYATAKRKAESGDGFEPELSAATKNLGDRVEIRIRDNGTGIPPEVREKIFNPFFTTKPAGEGTGLGLSMSHDIIVKQHGGTIDVETEPGAFTEFIVTLPRAGLAGP
jgi:GAF domain-containing protein